MNSDMLLNRIRMAQQGLIGVHKKLYTLEHLLPSPDPAQFAETAKSAALLSERSTASLRGFLFTTTGGMPEGYYQQAAAAQGIKVSATDDYVFVRVPALLPKKKARNIAVSTRCHIFRIVLFALNTSMTAACPSPQFGIMTIWNSNPP